MDITYEKQLAEARGKFGQHESTDETLELSTQLRNNFIVTDIFLQDALPDGRAKDLARTALEDAAMWANKALFEKNPLKES